MSKKVEEQKGPIRVGIPTYKTQTHTERLQDAVRDKKAMRDGQTCGFMTPKTGKK